MNMTKKYREISIFWSLFESEGLSSRGDMSDLQDNIEDGEGLEESLDGIALTAADIPGAELSEPWDKHPVAALKWWLLCRGIKAPSSVRKKDLIDRCLKLWQE